MKLIPVLSEKSLKLIKEGGFTFLVPMDLTKFDIKELVESVFGVHVVSVKTLNFKSGIKKNARGRIQRIKAFKKTVVFLRDGEKIDLFDEEKKTKKKASKKK